MINKEVAQILTEIQNDCTERSMCAGCKFYTTSGCALSQIPADWDLNRVISYTKEDSRQGLSLDEFAEAYEELTQGRKENE